MDIHIKILMNVIFYKNKFSNNFIASFEENFKI